MQNAGNLEVIIEYIDYFSGDALQGVLFFRGFFAVFLITIFAKPDGSGKPHAVEA